MLHKKRTWCVTMLSDPDDLARKLTEHTWTGCTGFELGEYLFLNDSTCADGAQEYAIVKKPLTPGGEYVQIESITFGWCTYEKALQYIRDILAGSYDDVDFRVTVTPRLETSATHGHCHFCA